MFDIGWQELFIVAVLGVIVVGPKDLPRAMRTVMGLVRKGRALASDFQSGIDEMVREADLDDLKKKMEETADIDLDAGLDLGKELEKKLDPTGEVAGAADMDDIRADLDEAARSTAPPPPTDPEPAAEAPVPEDGAAAAAKTEQTNG